MYKFRYKGFDGEVKWCSECEIWTGKVTNSTDTITFKSKQFEDVELAFQDSIDDYLEKNKEF